MSGTLIARDFVEDNPVSVTSVFQWIDGFLEGTVLEGDHCLDDCGRPFGCFIALDEFRLPILDITVAKARQDVIDGNIRNAAPCIEVLFIALKHCNGALLESCCVDGVLRLVDKFGGRGYVTRAQGLEVLGNNGFGFSHILCFPASRETEDAGEKDEEAC